MAPIGGQTNMAQRLRALLPGNWFPQGTAPTLWTVLQGPASALAWVYGLLAYVKTQMRIATAVGGMLDIMSFDYFGYGLLRRVGEGDAPFSARIRGALLAPLVTRAAMVAALTRLTGRAPVIFEAFNTADAGCYGATQYYGAAGGYGSYALPAQCFVIAYRPVVAGPGYIAGYGSSAGGYKKGAFAYITPAQEAGVLEDQEIYNTINATKAAGVVVWTAIED